MSLTNNNDEEIFIDCSITAHSMWDIARKFPEITSKNIWWLNEKVQNMVSRNKLAKKGAHRRDSEKRNTRKQRMRLREQWRKPKKKHMYIFFRKKGKCAKLQQLQNPKSY